ncbi:MAG: glycine cleavage system H protein [Verrucomicrobiales bacterium]|jgi:glycine cleavage system H protein
MSQPENVKFAESHEWITTGEDVATIGISHHAQEELSDIVFVELPEVGRTVEKGESVAVVESVKAASDIYAPAGGEITEINTALEDDPAKVNADAFGEGWLFKIKLADATELDALLTPESYSAQIS